MSTTRKKPEEKDTVTSDTKNTLRADAEKKLARSDARSPVSTVQSIDELVHELRVHQIELEMQNEALRTAQLALEDSRDKYLDLYEFAPLGYLTLTDKGVVIEANLSSAMLLGVERNKLIKSRFSKFIPGNDTDSWHLFFVNVLKHHEKQHCTLTLIRGGTTLFPARLEGVRIDNPENSSVSVRVAFNDITDIREGENALRESEKKYRGIFAAESDGIFVVDQETGKIIDCNDAFPSMYGYRKDEIIGLYINVLSAGPESIRSSVNDLTRYFPITYHRRKDGRVFPVEITASVITLQGRENVIAAVRDITDRKQAEDELMRKHYELKDALAEKEVLISEIHHRVKNNLSAFIALLSLEGTFEDSPTGKALMKDLQNRARTMALIHETLYKTHQYANVDMDLYLSTLVDQVVNSYSSVQSVKISIDAKGVELDLARATPIGLIINELVTNSLKYAFPKVTIATLKDQNGLKTIGIQLLKEKGTYLLKVYDNGVGLPADFDLEKTRTLGLKLVNFLARHQLRATPEVSREHGTEFVFRFQDRIS